MRDQDAGAGAPGIPTGSKSTPPLRASVLMCGTKLARKPGRAHCSLSPISYSYDRGEGGGGGCLQVGQPW